MLLSLHVYQLWKKRSLIQFCQLLKIDFSLKLEKYKALKAAAAVDGTGKKKLRKTDDSTQAKATDVLNVDSDDESSDNKSSDEENE